MKIKSLLTALLLLSPLASQAQLSITFDYTFDDSTLGFGGNNVFSGANVGRRTYLEAAASAFTGRLADTFDAITPGGANSWEAQFFNPTDPTNPLSNESVANPTIPANTIVIYAGGAPDLGSGVLGLGGPGGFDTAPGGSAAFYTSIQSRGEYALSTPAGSQTDFGAWGGSIAFDSDDIWYFDSDLSSDTDIPSDRYDFYTVALHELAHVFGFGIANSWNNLVSGDNFTGSTSMTLEGGPVPLNGDRLDAMGNPDPDYAHWQNGVDSILADSSPQEALMDPDLMIGTRKYATELDIAGLKDMGYEAVVVPEPMEYALVAGLGLLGFAVYRRRAARQV